jgi:hypothetical protein
VSRASERSEGEAVNGGQGRRVRKAPRVPLAGLIQSPEKKKTGKLVRAAVEARYRAGRCCVGPALGTADVTVSREPSQSLYWID